MIEIFFLQIQIYKSVVHICIKLSLLRYLYVQNPTNYLPFYTFFKHVCSHHGKICDETTDRKVRDNIQRFKRGSDFKTISKSLWILAQQNYDDWKSTNHYWSRQREL